MSESHSVSSKTLANKRRPDHETCEHGTPLVDFCEECDEEMMEDDGMDYLSECGDK